MNDRPKHTAFHPRWHRTRLSTYWWLKRWSYFLFILREFSSIFVAWSIVFLLLLTRAASQGQPTYEQFLAWSRNPVVLGLNLLSLCFVLFHAITWFNLAPQAMVMRLRGKRVPGIWIAASNYFAWALVSAILAWVVLGG